MKRSAHRTTLLLPGAIIALAAALRFYCLTCHSLWSDEGNSIALARQSFAEIARRTAFDIHPPLYYWLLRLWTLLFADSETALRSLSALLGVGLVWLTWLIGRRLFGRRVGLTAAFVTALSPLLVYYAQETRMYTLLAFLSALTVWLVIGQWSLVNGPWFRGRRWLFRTLYVVTVTTGLYTHYAYPLILIVVNAAALYHFTHHSPFKKSQPVSNERKSGETPPNAPRPAAWVGLQLIPLLLYLPWLPTAWRQLTTWPSQPHNFTLPEILATITTTLWFGLSWPYELRWPALALTGLAVGLPLLGLLPSRQQKQASGLLLLYLWLGLPLLLTAAIFSPAFLKFLVVAVPPLALLLGVAVDNLATLPRPNWQKAGLVGLLLGSITLVSALALYHYYTNPRFARDNYRGIAHYLAAVAGEQDAIVLNAEGQQDVFGYYNHANAPVYPLPRQRPLDEEETLATLQTISHSAKTIYAVYWAQQQADPTGMIESWLDTHLFKAADQWYGNVRLVSYATPTTDLAFQPIAAQLGDSIRLTGYGLAAPQAAPGDILQTALVWQADAPLSVDYTVFLQLLDGANHVVGQRDAPPVMPSSAWPPGQPLTDTHGIFIEPGTPPGPHRLIVGLYQPATGARLPVTQNGTPAGDFVTLGQIEIHQPATPLPAAAYQIQQPADVTLGGLRLHGYDLYKVGHRTTPNTPLRPGEPLHISLYWQKTADSEPHPQIQLQVVDQAGQPAGAALTLSPAGVDYPPERWQPGEIVRGQATLFLGDVAPGQYRLAITGNKKTTQSEPFRVE